MTIKFTVEFKVAGGSTTPESYMRFINDLRGRLGSDRFSHNRPVLPREVDRPTEFFDVVVSTNAHSVRFRFRTDNLYLLGYQMESGQWLELDNWVRDPDDKKKKILVHLLTEAGIQWLGFEGSYVALQRASGQEMELNRITSYTLELAINNLAQTTDGQERARSLIVVIMMISESTRLIPMSSHIVDYFNTQNATEARIEPWIQNLVTCWGSLSSTVQQADAFPEVSFTLPSASRVQISPVKEDKVRTLAQIVAIIALLKFKCFSTKSRVPVVTSRSSGEGMCYLGSPLLQVFSVRINNIDGENPGQLYGTITIDSGLFLQYIYNRESGDNESITPGQNATLTGPTYSPMALDQITIKLHLKDHDSISADDVIIDDSIYWDVYSNANVYDELLSTELSSSTGSVTLNYAVFRNAVQAEITIILEEGGEDWSEVIGEASVHYYGIDSSDATTCLLFKKTSDDYAEVRRWQRIPLLRSILSVPLDSPLKLTASLYDYDPISADDLIAQGSIELDAPDDIPGNTFQKINGDDGNYVTVGIRWSFAI